MDLSGLRAFVEVMRRGSFAAVARDRGVAASSISRAIAALEDELGIRLFHRSTRRLAPTEAGALYFARVEPLLEELEHARLIVGDIGEQPRGTLRMTAPVSFAQVNLVPLLPELAATYPALDLELLLSDRHSDLVAERIDLAIRLGRLADSNLVARQLCPMVSLVCASPDYLAQHGHPETPAALADHDCLVFPMAGWNSRWLFRPRGRNGVDVLEVPVRGRHTISNALALARCAMAGMGLCLLPRWIIGRQLHDGSLIDVFPDHEVSATDFDTAAWLLYPSRAYLPLKVRAVVDFLIARFRDGAPGESPHSSASPLAPDRDR